MALPSDKSGRLDRDSESDHGISREESWKQLSVTQLKKILYFDVPLRDTLFHAEEVAAHFNSLPARNLEGEKKGPKSHVRVCSFHNLTKTYNTALFL